MTAATDVEVVPHQGIQAWLNRPDIPLAGFSAGDKSVPVHDTYEDIVSKLKRFTKPPPESRFSSPMGLSYDFK